MWNKLLVLLIQIVLSKIKNNETRLRRIAATTTTRLRRLLVVAAMVTSLSGEKINLDKLCFTPAQ